jgi:hypothetical protein
MIQETVNELREFAVSAGDDMSEDYLTLYLLVDPSYPENQSETPAWKVFLRNAVADVEAGLDPVQTKQWKKVRLNDTSPETAWARTRKRLEKYEAGYSPRGKTLVLLINPNGERRFELPVRLPNAYYYGRPRIQEFLWALDEYQQHLVLLFSEDQTRALLVTLGEPTGDLTIVSDQIWLREMRKSDKAFAIKARQAELSRRYVRSVAGDVDKYFLRNPDVERIILGGNVEMANAVLAALHQASREKVIAVLPIPFTTPAHEVIKRIRQMAQEAERDHEAALVSEILAQAAAGGRGATGSIAVGRALERATVRLLALPYPSDPKTVEPLLWQALRLGSDIEFLHDEAAERVREAGGVIARLHYAVQ